MIADTPGNRRSDRVDATSTLDHDQLIRETPARAPQQLLARAIRGYQAGVLHPGAIARLRGVTVDAIERGLQEAGIVPDLLKSTDDPLPLVDLNDDELDKLLRNGPEPA